MTEIPLPSALVRAPVTWTLGHADTTGPLKAARGFVRFEASAIAVAYSDRTVLPSPVETPFVGGVMDPVDLIVNDPDIWNWKVTVKAGGVIWDPFHINVPAEGTNLASASITPGKGPVKVLKGDRGAQGASLDSLEQIADDTLRAVIHDPLTGVDDVKTFDLPRGPEGPYGGTEVTDPQVASYIGAPTETTTALDKGYRRGISVLEYGADPTGVADSSLAFQAALDAAGTNAGALHSGITVHIPAGEYKISEGLTVPDYTTLAGDGHRSSLIQYSGTGAAITVGMRYVVRDLWLRGTSAPGTVGIAASKGSFKSGYGKLDHVNVAYFGKGIQVKENYFAAIIECFPNYCDIGLSLESPHVNAIRVTGGDFMSNRIGVSITGVTGNKVNLVETTFEANSEAAVKVAGSVHSLAVRGGYFEAHTGTHILVVDDGQGGRPRGATLTDNFFSGDIPAIDMAVGTGTRVEGNDFIGQATPMMFRAGVDATMIGKNQFLSTAWSFTPGTHYLGTNLTLLADTMRVPGSISTGTAQILSGSAWPESTATAPPGSLYLRSNGLLYFKKTGTGNTGWVTVTLGATAN